MAGPLGQADSAAQEPRPEESSTNTQTSAPDDDDSFDDVPTVANRPMPTAVPDVPPAEPTPGIGAYRLVRPATSDTVPPPPAAKPRKPTRVVLGVARK
jgi:hypothetical protein